MKRISVFIVAVLVVVFAFTSVAWAGPAISRDLQQVQYANDDNSSQMAQNNNQYKLPKKPGGDKHPIIKHPGGDKHPEIKHPGGDKHPGIKHPGGDKHPEIKHPGGDKHPGIKHPGGDKHPGIKHPGGDKHHPHERHDGHRYHHWDRGWPHDRPWGHYFHDWDWFVTFGVIGLGAYYLAEDVDNVVYIHFETENRAYFREVTQRYGSYIYRERVAGFGGEGWRYYWINDQNVVCVFVRDDGYTHTFIWNRTEAGSQAITLGLLTGDQLVAYSEYNSDMPAALAAEYIRIVMWGQTEWE
ncbi:MAG: hypothetical protein Q8912_09400 [Bacillota bacterium]|nr:hypothetical protein [Bacillota bacterium]